MEIGLIVAEFFEYGLIFCSDNKLRYFSCMIASEPIDNGWLFDEDEGKANIFSLIRSNSNYDADRRQHVFITKRIDSDLIAKYEVDEEDPDKVIITELLYDIDNLLYEYRQKDANKKKEEYECDLLWYVNHYYDTIEGLDCKDCIEKVSHYFETLSIGSILSTYTIIKSSKMCNENGQSFQEISTSVNLNSDDSYIKSLIVRKPEVYRIQNNNSEECEERLYELEKNDVDDFLKKYDKSEHYKFILRETINNAIKNKTENLIRLQKFQSLFRLDDIIYILTYLRPHMSVSMLCRKFNKEYNGTNMTALFGKENSSRKRKYREYQSRLENSRRESRKLRLYCRDSRKLKSYDNYSSYDPESEIMDALERGDGELYGF